MASAAVQSSATAATSSPLAGASGVGSSTPLARLICTAALSTSSVRPSRPRKLAPPTAAFRATKLRRSVTTVGAAGALASRRAKAKSTPVSASPVAPGVPAGPLTPAKALTPVAPSVSRSAATGAVPPGSVARVELFSNAKLPLTWKKP